MRGRVGEGRGRKISQLVVSVAKPKVSLQPIDIAVNVRSLTRALAIYNLFSDWLRTGDDASVLLSRESSRLFAYRLRPIHRTEASSNNLFSLALFFGHAHTLLNVSTAHACERSNDIITYFMGVKGNYFQITKHVYYTLLICLLILIKQTKIKSYQPQTQILCHLCKSVLNFMLHFT